MVSNAALRFRPTQEMIASMQQRRERERAQSPDSAQQQGRQGATGRGLPGGGQPNGFQRPSNAGTLWYLDENGEVSMARVRTGISDGRSTEVTGRTVEEGLDVITAATGGTPATNNNPFQGQTQRRRPGGF